MSRLAVVCGGSRGIGKAVSRLLAERGCRLAVVSRDEGAARATVASLHGGDHVAFSCDVSKEQEVQKTFDTIKKTCGNISYLVNAAGVNRDALLLRTQPEDMVAVLHTNLLGTMLTCRAALRSMLHTQGAAIVNIGFIHTDMTTGQREEDWVRSIPLGRFGEPEEGDPLTAGPCCSPPLVVPRPEPTSGGACRGARHVGLQLEEIRGGGGGGGGIFSPGNVLSVWLQLWSCSVDGWGWR
ncbi:carbonyl reductase family member 4 isoform X3 [Toxotes jaculatrix]|uniref:carbonyl reductase family member 4 isoform X3 n=1 Tax=Toxotes jaculatrix TaxID=941984 RepID=UPI001B3AE383|nr:carbonyl reductase family member 4 isoform X3 [Toxotes jaculatrix]